MTSVTAERKPFFRHERWAKLFLEVLYSYRADFFQLHEFVIMHDHFHLLITPTTSLEKAVQFIKGGFSRKASLQFQTREQVWQRGFSDHCIRDYDDYDKHRQYIWLNPIKAGHCSAASQYLYGSASGKYEMDPIPQGLKPNRVGIFGGTAEAVPFPVSTDAMKEFSRK